MSDEKLRLGGMALRNGLALFGPTSWAAAVRTADGGIRVASGPRPRFRVADRVPVARGVVRMSEMLAALPVIRRRLPEARLSFEHGGVATATVLCAALATVVKRRGGVRAELGSTLIGIVPSLHAAQPRPRALPRRRAQDGGRLRAECGPRRRRGARAAAHASLRPLLLDAAGAAGKLRARPAGLRRPVGALGSLAAVGFAFELFAWRERHPETAGARCAGKSIPARRCSARSRRPSPGEAELEVAERALTALLAAEERGASA